MQTNKQSTEMHRIEMCLKVLCRLHPNSSQNITLYHCHHPVDEQHVQRLQQDRTVVGGHALPSRHSGDIVCVLCTLLLTHLTEHFQ